MNQFLKNNDEVCQHFKNGDINLGYRRFIDCALDADDCSVFSEVLDFCNWFDENPNVTNTDILLRIEPILKHIADVSKEPVLSNNIVINANNVAKKYRYGNFQLSPLSFELKKNQIVGLVGENGNGKTTLLRILAKELEPDQGNIEFPFSTTKSNYTLRTKLVYVPQRIPRWYGTLMDNLHFTLALHGIKNERNILLSEMLVARLGLRPFKNLGWNRISSGYKTRFELAKNLLREPQLLLLDEPLANLDILSQQTILQDLKHLAQSITKPFGAVLSSQQLFEVEKISDMVIFLKNGSPKYQFKDKTQNEPLHEVVFEVEADVTKDVLQQVFMDCNVNKIVNNGGVYLVHFNSSTSTHEIYNAIAKSNHEFTYVRNISHSSRRYFVNG